MLFLCNLIKDVIKLYKKALISFVLVSLSIFLGVPDYSLAYTLNAVISSACVEYGLSEQLVYCVIKAESNFNEKAVSHCDARGLMQITRPTWEWITREYLKVDWDYDTCCFDFEKNIIVGARFLKWISDYLDERQELLNAPKQDLLLACYNAGPGNVRKYNYTVPPFNETRHYVEKINVMTRSQALVLVLQPNQS